MKTSILVVLLLIAVIGWGVNKLNVLALCHYLTVKEYSPPSKEEMKASIEFVIRQTF